MASASDTCCFICYLKEENIHSMVASIILRIKFDVVSDLEKDKLDAVLTFTHKDSRARLLKVMSEYVDRHGIKGLPIIHRGYLQRNVLSVGQEFIFQDGQILEIFYSDDQTSYAANLLEQLIAQSLELVIDQRKYQDLKNVEHDRTIVFSNEGISIHWPSGFLELDAANKADNMLNTAKANLKEQLSARLCIIKNLKKSGDQQHVRIKDFVDFFNSYYGDLSGLKVAFFKEIPGSNTSTQKLKQIAANLNYGLDADTRKHVYIADLTSDAFRIGQKVLVVPMLNM